MSNWRQSACTKAITAIHYAGGGWEMDDIREMAGCRGIQVFADNAHGLPGS